MLDLFDPDSKDRPARLKRQKIWVIFAECMMVLSVVAIVVIATLLAMGYSFTKDGTVEQTGLMQLHSMPTGATVTIDGEEQSALSHTNMSKSLSPTTHHIKLTRDGYDTWEKDINIISGRVNRIYYPRLFLTDRTSDAVADFSDNLSFYSVATNRKTALYADVDNPIWHVIDLNSDDATQRDVDGTTFWTDANPLGTITSTEWSEDGNILLIASQVDTATTWYLLNLQDMSKSLNLNTTFGLNFEKVTLASESADKLFTLENGNLREINVASQDLSRILVANVSEFDNDADLLSYVQQVDSQISIGTYRSGEQGGATVATYSNLAEPVHVATSAYYSDEYLAVSIGTKLTVRIGKYPNYTADATAISDTFQTAAEVDLPFTPSALHHSYGGEYIYTTQQDTTTENPATTVAIFDLEQSALINFTAPVSVNWLDEGTFYWVNDHNLTVSDFDGTNQRQLATDVADRAVTITENNKYLYYINSNSQLVQVQILN